MDELNALLASKPRPADAMGGLKAESKDVVRTYGEELKRFERIFLSASNDPKPLYGCGWERCEYGKGHAKEGQSVELECGRGFAALETGFHATVETARFDDVEATKAAQSLASKFEKDACTELIFALQSELFVRGIRIAHAEAYLSMARRGFANERLTQDMIMLVHMPEVAGKGLPEILRRVVARGGLAVAVWLAVVENRTVGELWDMVKRAGEIERDVRHDEEVARNKAELEDKIFFLSTQKQCALADLKRIDDAIEEAQTTLEEYKDE